MKASKIAFFICVLSLLGTAFLFYPKWQQTRTEATLSWDVSGYYLYLPALFIYKDIKKVDFLEGIITKYYPTPDPQQVFPHWSGNRIMKYSAGMSVQYLPFFIIANIMAPILGYPADGFSFPYQFAIGFGSLLIAILGLWFTRKNLLHFFEEIPAAIALILIAIGTNYLDYTAINGAMSHNYLFTIYAILINLTIHFYNKPTLGKSLGIGALVGLAALTRPTEIISCLIPILWGLDSKNAIQERVQFWLKRLPFLVSAGIVCVLVGSIQLLYWKLIAQEWLVYSYRKQGFSWLHPHLYKGIFSYRTGWLVYSPILIFALIGFITFYKNYRSQFWALFGFFMLFIYIVFAWDEWWYGGSLGQRAMVQSYAVLAIPLTSFIQFIYKKRPWNYIFYAICMLFIYYNAWLTYQAHGGGLLEIGGMTRGYFWKVVGRYEVNNEYRKLLDSHDFYEGERKDVKVIYENNFEQDTATTPCPIPPIEGQRSACLSQTLKFTPIYGFPLQNNNAAKWMRVAADFRCQARESENWKMAQFIVRFMNNEQEVTSRMMRVYRFLNDNETKRLYQDVKLPRKTFNRVEILFWNVESDKALAIDSLTAELFNAK